MSFANLRAISKSITKKGEIIKVEIKKSSPIPVGSDNKLVIQEPLEDTVVTLLAVDVNPDTVVMGAELYKYIIEPRKAMITI